MLALQICSKLWTEQNEWDFVDAGCSISWTHAYNVAPGCYVFIPPSYHQIIGFVLWRLSFTFSDYFFIDRRVQLPATCELRCVVFEVLFCYFLFSFCLHPNDRKANDLICKQVVFVLIRKTRSFWVPFHLQNSYFNLNHYLSQSFLGFFCLNITKPY